MTHAFRVRDKKRIPYGQFPTDVFFVEKSSDWSSDINQGTLYADYREAEAVVQEHGGDIEIIDNIPTVDAPQAVQPGDSTLRKLQCDAEGCSSPRLYGRVYCGVHMSEFNKEGVEKQTMPPLSTAPCSVNVHLTPRGERMVGAQQAIKIAAKMLLDEFDSSCDKRCLIHGTTLLVLLQEMVCRED